jgi:hypothetical protein
MSHLIKTAALALMAPAMLVTATPALADRDDYGRYERYERHDNGKHRGHYKRKHYQRYDNYNTYYRPDYRQQVYYGEPIYNNTRTWRGDDGRYYCRKNDGTTGLIVGGVAGALLGREVAGRYGDRTAGAIIGAAGGALIGRAIDRGGSNNGYCR